LFMVEHELDRLYNSDGRGFLLDQDNSSLLSLEEKKEKLLAEKEEAWRLKSRALWLSSGDENTTFSSLC